MINYVVKKRNKKGKEKRIKKKNLERDKKHKGVTFKFTVHACNVPK